MRRITIVPKSRSLNNQSGIYLTYEPDGRRGRKKGLYIQYWKDIEFYQYQICLSNVYLLAIEHEDRVITSFCVLFPSITLLPKLKCFKLSVSGWCTWTQNGSLEAEVKSIAETLLILSINAGINATHQKWLPLHQILENVLKRIRRHNDDDDDDNNIIIIIITTKIILQVNK